MPLICGLSFIEVLITLFLASSMSLALLKQQWQTHQLFNQAYFQANACLQLDNASERVLAGLPAEELAEPFRVESLSVGHKTTLQIEWSLWNRGQQELQHLQREVWR